MGKGIGLRLGNGGDLSLGLRRAHHARMAVQSDKRRAANSIRRQHAKGERRRRRANQNQHIHCILHKNYSNYRMPSRARLRPFDPMPDKMFRIVLTAILTMSWLSEKASR